MVYHQQGDADVVSNKMRLWYCENEDVVWLFSIGKRPRCILTGLRHMKDNSHLYDIAVVVRYDKDNCTFGQNESPLPSVHQIGPNDFIP